MALQPCQQRIHHELQALVLDVVIGRFRQHLHHMWRDFVEAANLFHAPLTRLQQLRFLVILRHLLVAHTLLQQRHREHVVYTGISVGPFGQKLVNLFLTFDCWRFFRAFNNATHRCPASEYCRCMLFHRQIQPEYVGVRLNGRGTDIAIQRKYFHMVHHAHW
ncbi:Uncharacterised protein [Klebsiella pneumoniae]|nr:Uncharacterised protein [Klebsiella pneumoniae]